MSTGAQDALAIIVAAGLFAVWIWIILRKPSDSPWMREYRKRIRHDDEPWHGPCDKD
jgi:hypothetical protein